MSKNRILGIVFLVAFYGAQSQVNRYMVFFSDKDTATWSAENATAYLSERAIARREKQGIEISAQDFPINEAYADSITSLGMEVYYESKWLNGVLVQGDEQKVSTLIGLGFVTEVEYIAPNTLLQRDQQVPQIPETFKEPPNVNASSSTQLKMLYADKMHADGFQGQGMWIAIVDNGFRGVNEYAPFEHLFSQNKIVATKDFVANTGNVYQFGTHGTQVLSTISAKYGNSMIGTAPEAHVVLCITEADAENRIEEYNWLLAMEYIDSIGVDVVNSSLGYNTFDDPSMNYTKSDLDGNTSVITRAANIAARKGIIVVSSAGNTGGDKSWSKVTFPADAKDILSVGSVNGEWGKSGFSSFGPTADGRIKPDVCALGDPTTVVNGSGTIKKSSGTSFSSPLVAGFAACIWQANPEWDYLKVIAEIKKSGRNSEVPDTLIGYGVPNYLSISNPNGLAIKKLLEPELKVFPNPFTENYFTIDFQGTMLNESIVIALVDANGKRIYKKKLTERNRPDQLLIEFKSTEKGIYFLTLTTQNLIKTIKLVKI